MKTPLRIFLVILAIGEWLISALLYLVAFSFGVDTGIGGKFLIVGGLITVIAITYPLIFGALLFLFRKKTGRREQWYWFIAGFNVFPIVLYVLTKILDNVGLY